jgi:hypothetical protein
LLNKDTILIPTTLLVFGLTAAAVALLYVAFEVHPYRTIVTLYAMDTVIRGAKIIQADVTIPGQLSMWWAWALAVAASAGAHFCLGAFYGPLL